MNGSARVQPSRSKRVVKTLGPDSVMGEGDTELVLNIAPDDLAKDAFELLRKEVNWQTMFHRGGEVPRLVAVQGEVGEDGSYPIYRHPADASPPLSPFSPTVARIRAHIEQHLNHPVNHVLIQHYRSGHDFISEHSDKTIDVVRGSRIVNVSFGAERLMILRPKRDKAAADAEANGSATPDSRPPPRAAQRIPLPHNSMFVLGLDTNAKWLHSIRQDKRLESMKTSAELFNKGERISLTFRQIGTFLNADETHIWGQGATGKTKADAKPVINGNRSASQKLIEAFGDENQHSDFDWDAVYGPGFDVLHFKAQAPVPTLYYVNGSIPSWRVMLALYEKGVTFHAERLKVMSDPKETRLPAFLAINPRGKTPVLVDKDTTVNESLAILSYVETYYAPEHPLLPPLERRADRARVLARIQETENLHSAYDALEDAHFQKHSTHALSPTERTELVQAVETELAFWERYASESENAYIAGDEFTLADCAFFPILAYMLHRGLALESARWPGLVAYLARVRARPSGCAQRAQPEGWKVPAGVNVFTGTKGGGGGGKVYHNTNGTNHAQ